MAYGYNSQGQIVWVDSDSPHGGTALPTSEITGSWVDPTQLDPNNPLDRLGLRQGGSGTSGPIWNIIRGPLPPGKKYDANGNIVNTTAFEKFDTGFNNAAAYGGAGLGIAAGGLALGGLAAGAYGGAAAGGGAAPAGAFSGGGSGIAGSSGLGAAYGGGGAAAGGGSAAAGTGFGALAGAPGTGGFGALAGGGTLGSTALGGSTAIPATVTGGGAAAGGGAHLASLAKAYGPLAASVFGTLWGNRETSAEKAQAAAIEQQRQYLAYQMAKQKAQDPIQDAIIRMAMGMMPTYSQNLFTNYQGLPGVSAPNPNAHYSAPGIGGGGYGGGASGPSRR